MNDQLIIRNKKYCEWRPSIWQILMMLFLITSIDVRAEDIAKTISLKLTNVTLRETMKAMRKQADVYFIFNEEELPKDVMLNIDISNVSIDEAVRTMLKDLPYMHQNLGDKVLIKPKEKITQQDTKSMVLLKGKITDRYGEPLPGVTVQIEGLAVGTVTNSKGVYHIDLKKNKPTTLKFSFIGMKSVIKEWTGEQVINIQLEEETLNMDEVVVTGYQTIDRKKVTSEITSVKATEILIDGMTSIDQALEGRIPDLVFTNNSGEVGATGRIRIRGTSTILGNREPLWVLDGFILVDPVDVSNDELNDPDYINLVGNAITGINPQDIDRIDILKDAAATALYGTRAANGVIVVTTKRGTFGKPRFSYNHNSKLTRRPRYSDKNINLMNSSERILFGKYLTEIDYTFPTYMPTIGYEGALQRWQLGQIDYESFMKEVKYYETVNTDWFNELCNDTYSHSHTVSMSGGHDAFRYYTSLGYNNDNGVSKGSYANRYSVRSNFDINLSTAIKVSFGLGASLQQKLHTPQNVNVMDYAYNTTRALPLKNQDGSLFFYKKVGYNGMNRSNELFRYNILNEIKNSSLEYDGNSINSSLNLMYSVFKGLDVTVAANYSISNTSQEEWWGEKSHYIARLKNGEYEDVPRPGEQGHSIIPYGGSLKNVNTNTKSYTARAQYDLRIYKGRDAQHCIISSGGLEMNGNVYKSNNQTKYGFYKDRGLKYVQDIDLDKFPYYTNWLNKTNTAKMHNITNQVSGYLSLQYGYKNHFNLNISGRIDASNKFGDRSRERLLPIVTYSANWILSDNILKNINFINYATINLSYGTQGNMLEDQSPNLLIQMGSIDPIYNENISTISRFPNPNLRWEETKSSNLGINFTLFQNRLNLGGSLYYKKTKDAFTSINVSSVNGVSGNTYVMNGGDISNSGYSINISGTIIRNKNVNWRLSTYYSASFNKLESDDEKTYTYSDYLTGAALVTGMPIGTFYSYRYMGLNPNLGTPLFDDYMDRQNLLRDKTLEETILMTMSASGQRESKFSGGFSTSLKLFKFSISANFKYRLGSKIRLFPLYAPIAQSGVSAETNVRKEFNNRWLVPGDEEYTDVPVIMNPSHPEYDNFAYHYSTSYGAKVQTFAANHWTMYDNSDLRVVSGDFLRCSSLSLKYNIDSKLLVGLPLSNVSIGISALNLFTLASKKLNGQDPSQAGFSSINLSLRPSYSVSLNVSF